MVIKKPLVSIIMAAFNSEMYIADSIKSVIHQSLDQWELIIVNDGSTDRTDSIIRYFDDSRIRHVITQNKGVSAARNIGLSLSNSDLICFLDSDDTFPVNSLEVRFDFMNKNPECQYLDGIVNVFNESMNTVVREYIPLFSGKVAKKYIRLDSSVFFGPNIMVRKNAISIAFDESMTHAEDLWFYTANAWVNDVNYCCVQEVIYHYRKLNNSAMSKLDKLESGYFQYLNNVSRLQRVSALDLDYLYKKIKLIMVKSYLRKLMLGNALKVLFK